MKKQEEKAKNCDFFVSEALLELSPNLVFFLSRENKIVCLSRVAAEHSLVQKKEVMEGSLIFDIFDNPVLKLLVKTWCDKLDLGESIDEIVPLENSSTKKFDWFQVKASCVQANEEIMGKFLFISDITDLYLNKKILDATMVSSSSETVVFDRHLKILFASDKFAEKNGFVSCRDVEGKLLTDLPSLDIENIKNMIDSAVLTDQPVQDICEEDCKNIDSRWYYNDLRTVKASFGVFGYVMNRFDITEEVKPKVMLEAIMQSTSESIAIVNPEGNYEYISKAFLHGLSNKDPSYYKGKPWASVFKEGGDNFAAIKKMFSGKEEKAISGSIDLEIEGSARHYSYKIDPLVYNQINFGVIAIGTDSTELVKAKDAAEAAVRAKAAFLANMSHELRTPMNAVLGMNELLLRTKLSAIQKNYVTQVKTSASLLLSLINDILDYSKIEDKKLVLHENVYDVDTLFRDVINMISVKNSEKGLSFTVDIDPSIPSKLVGDDLRVKQIMINLLNNAVKFTDKGEVNLTITGRFEEGTTNYFLSIQVKDTGIGIPYEQQSELFERFSRIQSSRNASVEGTGLGLAICKNLVSLMGGTLVFASEEGVGSVFTAIITQKALPKVEPYAQFPNTNSLSLFVYVRDTAIRESIHKMSVYAGVRTTLCKTKMRLQECLPTINEKPTHIIFDQSEEVETIQAYATAETEIKFLGLLSLTDTIDTLSHSSIDYVFNPLDIRVFSQFLKGMRVDFTSSIPLSSGINFDPQDYRIEGVTIMIVDDSIINRKVIEGFLTPLGVAIVEAASGEEALKKLLTEKVDLIFMDHLMVGMDGIETTKKIRENSSYTKIPIIALTANVGPAFVDLYKNSGMNDTLYKPIDINALLNCMKKWLSYEGDLATAPFGLEKLGVDTNAKAWIQGLDREKGIRYTGSLENLEMILKIFNKSGIKLFEALEKGRASGDKEEFRRAVHSLISTCGNIGATEVSSNARSLEQAIIADSFKEIELLYPIVHGGLQTILTNISNYVEERK